MDNHCIIVVVNSDACHMECYRNDSMLFVVKYVMLYCVSIQICLLCSFVQAYWHRGHIIGLLVLHTLYVGLFVCQTLEEWFTVVMT